MRTHAYTVLITLFSFTTSYCQDFGVGLRLGDPMGISVKKYLGDNALEISFGSTVHYRGYDYNYFYNHDNRYKNKNIYSVGYSRDYSIGIQVHYLLHQDLDVNIKGDLDWYFGVGGQFRLHKGTLHYWENGLYYEDPLSDYDIGPDGTIGMEYTFDGAPLSVFIDATVFLEIINRVDFHPQAAIGVRYNF